MPWKRTVYKKKNIKTENLNRYDRDIYYAKYYGKGGGKWPAGEKKIKLGVREKNEKGKEKRRKITLKKREKALNIHLSGL